MAAGLHAVQPVRIDPGPSTAALARSIHALGPANVVVTGFQGPSAACVARILQDRMAVALAKYRP